MAPHHKILKGLEEAPRRARRVGGSYVSETDDWEAPRKVDECLARAGYLGQQVAIRPQQRAQIHPT